VKTNLFGPDEVLTCGDAAWDGEFEPAKVAISEAEWAECCSPLCDLEPTTTGTIKRGDGRWGFGHIDGRGTDVVDGIIQTKGESSTGSNLYDIGSGSHAITSDTGRSDG